MTIHAHKWVWINSEVDAGWFCEMRGEPRPRPWIPLSEEDSIGLKTLAP